ncbi:hypothetical protein, partial [uncultured Roseibium sp.]|uniref:hypothetical protein n=1 Tax=uncultured Roseibium sp. TaxID=1936171 RepID=UPI00261BFA27
MAGMTTMVALHGNHSINWSGKQSKVLAECEINASDVLAMPHLRHPGRSVAKIRDRRTTNGPGWVMITHIGAHRSLLALRLAGMTTMVALHGNHSIIWSGIWSKVAAECEINASDVLAMPHLRHPGRSVAK